MRKDDELLRLMDEVRQISHGEENLRRAACWQPEETTARDHWRGKPRSSLDSGRIPFTVEPEIPMWGEILQFSVKEFYTQPITYLKNQLRMSIYRFRNFDDCTVIGQEIPIWLGTTLESSLFGAKTIFADNASPWLDREFVFKDKSALDGTPYPDFYNSGLMPLAHRFYEDMQELVDDDFSIVFPEWGRSPFGVAFHTRGHDQILIDMIDDPDYVRRLLRFITDARKQWAAERARFLGRAVDQGNLYNDEVNTPTLSPQLVEQFVVPYETELSQYHKGILYWHSCGDTTQLLEQIKRIPHIGMFHVGPWTSVARSKEVFGDTSCLEICLHPVRNIQHATESEMIAALEQVYEDAFGTAFTVRADGLQVLDTLAKDLQKINQWITIANRVLWRS